MVIDSMIDTLWLRSVEQCRSCTASMVCDYHMGYAKALVDFRDSINHELTLVGFDG